MALEHRIIIPLRRARDPLLDAADRYFERLGRYAETRLVRLKESHPEKEATDAEKHWQDCTLIALDERGASWTSVQLADFIQRSMDTGVSRLAWVLGGADGLDPAVRQKAKHVLSLSAMTLPHRFAFALLLEQLYRAHTILRQEQYHRP